MSATPDFQPGDVIPVKVGRKWYTTVIDAHGVQRFEEDPAVMARVAANPNIYNTMAIDYQEGRVSLLEYMEFNMKTGYSVGGWIDTLDCLEWETPTGTRRPQVTVLNPLLAAYGYSPREVFRG